MASLMRKIGSFIGIKTEMTEIAEIGTIIDISVDRNGFTEIAGSFS